DHRRPLRPRRALRRHPDRWVQAHGQACVQDGAAPPPLRALGLGRGDDRHPLLDHRVDLRGRGPRDLLRGVGGGSMTAAPEAVEPAVPLASAHVVVAGLGVTGRAVVTALAGRTARVTTVDAAAPDADVADGSVVDLTDVDVVVTSPGWRPDHPLLAGALAAGIPVWSEVELAWRLRVDRTGGRGPAPWLGVTGTNGKTTTIGMLTSILAAAGERVAEVG